MGRRRSSSPAGIKTTIRVRASGDQGMLGFTASARRVTIDPSRSSDDVEIEVWVPRGVRVEARTNSGDITIHGTRGDVDAQTSSGDVAITDVREVNATSLSGDVDIRQTTGAVTATTNNGDLSVSDAHGNIDATAISGDVSITPRGVEDRARGIDQRRASPIRAPSRPEGAMTSRPIPATSS